MIKGFLFDLDGVITDSAEYHYRAWKKLAEKIDIKIDREFNEQLKGVDRMNSLERILKYGNKENDFTEQEKAALAVEKNDDYLTLIQLITPEDILPGIMELMNKIKEHDLKMGLTSASKNAPFILEKLGISEMFDIVVDPATLSKSKPDPEIFLKGAQLLGLEPSQCIGVEDAEAGIESIRKAGMFSVGVGDEVSMRDADYRVETTAQLDFDKIMAAAGK
ncbi:beta-phosphoglucomutase [Vagococcus elongatus]|uniref:Beta-phosphoglucomutase n=1 Tax=Vagococcus elongatus TaxID=180344 RepID=A0A430APW3_9ENTE|nr:beta-phosphoglucomutase [Vagococcus elongatus]RSU10168.1 beta-phosphoglucomutase [Vagococcus elongatus]